MSQVSHIQPTTIVERHELKQRRLLRTRALWVLQVLLALIFLFAGSMKLIIPIEIMIKQMPVALPGMFLQFIGIAEIAGAIGLILPGLLHTRQGFTPLAATGLVIIMIGAAVLTLLSGEIASALVPLMIGLLCATVAYGRRAWTLA